MNIKLFCLKCKSELTNVYVKIRGEEDIDFQVDPCEECMSNTYDEGLDEGYCNGTNENN